VSLFDLLSLFLRARVELGGREVGFWELSKYPARWLGV